MKSVMKSFSPNAELLTSLSDENIFQKMKIKSLEEDFKKLKNENITVRENILTQLIILKMYQVTTKEKWQTLPSR